MYMNNELEILTVSKEREDIKILKIDTDEFSELAMKFGVMSIPTLILFKNGEVAKTIIGFRTKQQLETAINLD